MKALRIILISSLALAVPCTAQPQEKETPQVYVAKQNRQSSLTNHFTTRGFNLREYFEHKDFQIYRGIADSFRNSAESKVWKVFAQSSPEKRQRIFTELYQGYKEKIGFDNKVAKIHMFMGSNLEKLLEAEETYNVPKEVIAATLGVESDFGNNTGKYFAFNVFVSLYCQRFKVDFATTQLEELLKFTRRSGKEVFYFKSSYAGAIGYAQFIPSSLNRWFVGNDVYDIDSNILSVANYLADFLRSLGRLEEAVFRYNPSKSYVKAVLDLAERAQQPPPTD